MTHTTATATALDTSLTPRERDEARIYLNQSFDGLKGAIKGLSAPQWTFTPGPEQWSISQIAEHTLMVFELAAGPMRGKLALAPPPDSNHDRKRIDDIVINRFPNRIVKYPAPPFVQPTARFGSAAEAITLLEELRANLREYLESDFDFRAHAVEAMPLRAVTQGDDELMDAYQWFLAASAHAERHTKQILEIRANDEFPVC